MRSQVTRHLARSLAGTCPATATSCWQFAPAGLLQLLAASYTTSWPLQLQQTSSARDFADSTPHGDKHQQQASSDSDNAQSSSTSSTATTSSRDSTQQGERHKPASYEHEAQEVSKAFLAKSLDVEELWLAGVAGRLKIWSARAMTDLKGKEQDVVERVRTAYLDILRRHASGRMLGHRQRSQLKQVCLAVATYKVLLEINPADAKGVEDHIGDSMGGLYSPFLLGGLKLTSWAKRLLLRQSSTSQAVDTLHIIARDMEGACHVSVQPLCTDSDDSDSDQQQQQQSDSDATEAQQQQLEEKNPQAIAEEAAKQHHTAQEWQLGAALTVDSCMFADVLAEEGVLHLLRFFCCQYNLSWLEAYRGQGVDARLEACIGRGDPCCRMMVTPAESGV